MTLPTCWYCPECGSIERHRYTWAHTAGPLHPEWLDCGHKQVEFPVFPPGTPLPMILNALGHTYRAGWGLFYDPPETEWSAGPHRHENDVPVLVVDDPATVEAPGCRG